MAADEIRSLAAKKKPQKVHALLPVTGVAPVLKPFGQESVQTP